MALSWNQNGSTVNLQTFVILMQGMHWFGVIAAGFSISLNYSAVCYGISASSFAASS